MDYHAKGNILVLVALFAVITMLCTSVTVSAIFDCDGVNGCSGNGECVGQDICECYEGWTGNDCSEPLLTCFGIPSDDPTVCSGHGNCVAPDECVCYEEWTGADCSTQECTDADEDGYCAETDDCDDNNGDINPGAEEVCDGMDNNCDDEVDEGGHALCDYLDRDYCDGDFVMHDEGVCDDSGCEIIFIEGVNCYYHDEYCYGDDVQVEEGYCENAVCEVDYQTEACDDGMFCNGHERCEDGEGAICVHGTDIDCSPFDLSAIGTCLNDPDSNPFTWDYRMDFFSVCIEPGICTTGTNLTHTCDLECGAECKEDGDCEATECDHLDGCSDGIHRDYQDVPNTCSDGCECTENECTDYTEDADNDRDGFSASCGDCNDNNAEINPEAAEICNDRVDNDCDGLADCEDDDCMWGINSYNVMCGASPFVSWTHYGGFLTDTVIGDIDGKGGLDVAWVDLDGLMGPRTAYAVSGDGTELWSKEEYNHGEGSEIIEGLRIDMDGYIAIGRDGIVFALEKDGTERWMQYLGGHEYGGCFVTDIEMADINNDGVADVLAGESCMDDTLYALDGTNGQPLWEPFWHEVSALAVGDLNGEGAQDIVTINIGMEMPGDIVAINGDNGEELWHREDNFGRAIEIGDITGNGANEVVAGVYAEDEGEYCESTCGTITNPEECDTLDACYYDDEEGHCYTTWLCEEGIWDNRTECDATAGCQWHETYLDGFGVLALSGQGNPLWGI